MLRGQSHPNFIRWSICNGNKPRIFFVKGLGHANIMAGFIIAVVMTLSHLNRWYRIFAMIPWLIGFATIVASYKGLCIIMHHNHKRNLRPWEQGGADIERSVSRSTYATMTTAGSRTAQLSSKLCSYDNLGDHKDRSTSIEMYISNNAWENEKWVEDYEKKPLLRKIFCEENVWTQDETLRVLQDKIVLGAHLWSWIITLPLTVAFVALPSGNFF